MQKWLDEFNENSMRVFWFQRPCADIVDVQCPNNDCTKVQIKKVAVEYMPGVAPGFDVTQKGEFQWVHDMLGWPPGQLQRNLDRMEYWINKGCCDPPPVQLTYMHTSPCVPTHACVYATLFMHCFRACIRSLYAYFDCFVLRWRMVVVYDSMCMRDSGIHT